MLPMDEAIEGITDQAFAAAAHLPLYMHDGASRCRHSSASQRARAISSSHL
jgi:hypothetical protein